jgi:hypothetical protein
MTDKSPVSVPKQVHAEEHPERFPARPETPPPTDPAASIHVIAAMKDAFKRVLGDVEKHTRCVEEKKSELAQAEQEKTTAEGQLEGVLR